LKGPILDQGNYYPCERVLEIVAPDCLHLSVRTMTPSGTQNSAITLKGKIGWISWVDGRVTEMADPQIADVQSEIDYYEITSLIPLKEGACPMRPAEGVPLEKRETDAVQIQRKNHLVLTLFFDRESGLLVRTFGPHFEGGRQQNREMAFFDHKPFDGLVLPTRFSDVRDGAVVYPNNAIDYSFPTQIDPKEFEKPSK